MGKLKRVGLFLIGAALCGCGPSAMYDWGSYEPSVVHLYSPEPTAQAAKDRQKMIEEVRKTLDRKKQVPPGKYAQIGYLSYLSGDTAAAREYFQQERAAYPESAKFMDSLIGRLK